MTAGGSFVSALPQLFARSVHSSCVYIIPHILPCKPCSPIDFRQALPANDADGEVPSKVRGVRAARVKWHTCYGRRRGTKKDQKEGSLLSRLSRCCVLASLSLSCVLGLSRCCPGCPAVVRVVPLLSRCCPAVVPLSFL